MWQNLRKDFQGSELTNAAQSERLEVNFALQIRDGQNRVCDRKGLANIGKTIGSSSQVRRRSRIRAAQLAR